MTETFYRYRHLLWVEERQPTNIRSYFEHDYIWKRLIGDEQRDFARRYVSRYV